MTITRVGLESIERRPWSYHRFADSAYVHVGGLDYELTEGDVIVIFSQCVKTICRMTIVWIILAYLDMAK